ncbi:MAG: hypothetical protein BWY75_03158 [bacterium ADurb.Bin425]|nr:MAG: hypothetical protein BWY75_03158 [bacterium ADurb.Bin425]
MHQAVTQTIRRIHKRTQTAGGANNRPAGFEARYGTKVPREQLTGRRSRPKERKGKGTVTKGWRRLAALGQLKALSTDQTKGAAAVAERTADKDHIARARTAAPHHTGTVQVAHDCNGDHKPIAAGQVTAGNASTVAPGAVGETQIKLTQLRLTDIGRQSERNRHIAGHTAHGGNVAQINGTGFPAQRNQICPI